MDNQLDRWRRAQGLNFQQLADLLESSHETSCRYCRGRRIPNAAAMRKIYLLTAGAVRPDHFYDLPELPPGGAPVNKPPPRAAGPSPSRPAARPELISMETSP